MSTKAMLKLYFKTIFDKHAYPQIISEYKIICNGKLKDFLLNSLKFNQVLQN